MTQLIQRITLTELFLVLARVPMPPSSAAAISMSPAALFSTTE